MKHEGNDNVKWLGVDLTKKRACYLLVLNTIGMGIFVFLGYNAWVLLLNADIIYDYNRLIYYQILSLGFSNLVITFIVTSMFGYTLKKIRLYRKFLKVQAKEECEDFMIN